MTQNTAGMPFNNINATNTLPAPEIALAPRAFSAWPWQSGKIADLDRVFPSYLSAWDGHQMLDLDYGATHFGYVHEGCVDIIRADAPDMRVGTGYAFSVPGRASVLPFGGSRGIVVSREQFFGFGYTVGPIEEQGRLKYIDGCTDSLLIPPVKIGDPCLNLLYFPPGIDQTAHTHPSDRIGIILSGQGRCHYWDESSNWEEALIDLVPGMIFTIHTNGKHKFSTPYGENMRVLAYHPDSDFGPRDEDHPMLNRTIVEGVSAKNIDAIRTK